LDAFKGKGVANLAQQVYNTLNLEMKLAAQKVKFGADYTVTPVPFDE
jgi:hypothetical protein